MTRAKRNRNQSLHNNLGLLHGACKASRSQKPNSRKQRETALSLLYANFPAASVANIMSAPIAGLKSFTHSSAFFLSYRLYAKTAFHSPIVSHIFKSFTLFAHWKSLECDTYTHAANWLETHTYVLYVRWLTGLQLQLGRWCKQNHSLRHIPLLIQRELCNSPRVYVRSARIRCVPAE
jgi:hypothetical protein